MVVVQQINGYIMSSGNAEDWRVLTSFQAHWNGTNIILLARKTAADWFIVKTGSEQIPSVSTLSVFLGRAKCAIKMKELTGGEKRRHL